MTEDQIRAIPLDALSLTTRPHNCLSYSGIKCVGDIVDLFNEPERLAKIDNFGPRSFYEVAEKLIPLGVHLTNDPFVVARKINATRSHKARNPSKGPGMSIWFTQSELTQLKALELPTWASEKVLKALSKLA